MKNYEIPQLLPALNINWKIYKKAAPYDTLYFRVCFHHNKQYKKANIVNNIAVK